MLKAWPWVKNVRSEGNSIIKELRLIGREKELKKLKRLKEISSRLDKFDVVHAINDTLQNKQVKLTQDYLDYFKLELIHILTGLNRGEIKASEEVEDFVTGMLISLEGDGFHYSKLFMRNNLIDLKSNLKKRKDIHRDLKFLNSHYFKMQLDRMAHKKIVKAQTQDYPFSPEYQWKIPGELFNNVVVDVFKDLVEPKKMRFILDKNILFSDKVETPTTFGFDNVYPVICMGKKRNVKGLVTFCHEMGHAVHYLWGTDSAIVEEFVGQVFEFITYFKLRSDIRYHKYWQDLDEYFWSNYLEFYVLKLCHTQTSVGVINNKIGDASKIKRYSREVYKKYFGHQNSFFELDYELDGNFYSYDYLISYLYSFYVGRLIVQKPQEMKKLLMIMKRSRDLKISDLNKIFGIKNLEFLNEELLKFVCGHFE